MENREVLSVYKNLKSVDTDVYNVYKNLKSVDTDVYNVYRCLHKILHFVDALNAVIPTVSSQTSTMSTQYIKYY
jgi:hypothetical protein